MYNTRNKIIQGLKKNFQSNHSAIGLLLAGSSLDRTRINEKCDLDFIAVITGRQGKFEFYYDKKIWVEIFYEDEKRIKKCFDSNDEIMINCFKDGKILFDTQGKLAKLKELARILGKDYKISNYNLKKLKYRFQIMSFKIKNAYLERNLEKMAFLCTYVFPYLIRGIYIVNHKIPPTLSSWYNKDKFLKLKGGDLVMNLFETLTNSPSNKSINKLYNDFILLNNFLNSEMGGSLKEWRDIRRQQFQTFL